MTGEFNYQGGDRKTFYHHTGFPFANTWETFDNIGPVRGREDLLLGDVLVNTHSSDGAPPQPLVLSCRTQRRASAVFLPGHARSRAVSVLEAETARGNGSRLPRSLAVVVVMHVFVWPFTWNGGGGPIGSRYFLPFYRAVPGADSRRQRGGRGDGGVSRRRVVYGATRAESFLCVDCMPGNTPIPGPCGCCRSS